MPSAAFKYWTHAGALSLDEIVAAHAAVGGSGRGRRFATAQINHAYAVLLSSQFQKYCRDLHMQCVGSLTSAVANPAIQIILRAQLSDVRKLDSGNPNPGNIGHDFNRFGFVFWQAVVTHDPRAAANRDQLELLNSWRNAIAHQDFSSTRLGGRVQLRLKDVTLWRRSCNRLALVFDEAMRQQLHILTGVLPW